jgi:UDP:flavonoid glycosyltransferase YjiC (YdhE family)
VSARGLTAAKLADAIREVQKKPKYKEAAEKLRPKISLTSGPPRAADVIESTLPSTN